MQQQQHQYQLIQAYARSRPAGQSVFFGIVPTPRELALPPGQSTDDDVFEREHDGFGEPVDLLGRLTWRPHFPLALLPYYLPDRLCYTLHIRGVYYYYSSRPRAEPTNTATLDRNRDDLSFECILDPWGRPFNCTCTHTTEGNEGERRVPMEPITQHHRFIQCCHCKKWSHWNCVKDFDVDAADNEAAWECGRTRECLERVRARGKIQVAKKRLPDEERELKRMMLRQMINQRQEDEMFAAILGEDARRQCMDPSRMHEEEDAGPCSVAGV